MRVAILSYEFPPDTGFGGIGTHAWYQARALVRLGHEVHVVAGSLEPGTIHQEVDGVRLTRTLDPGPIAAAVPALEQDGLPWAANRLRTAFGAHRALRDACEHQDFDIVEFPECGADGLVVSTMLPVRTCVRFHSPARFIMDDYGADPRDVELTSFLEQVAIDRADVRIAVSRFLAAEVVERLGAAEPVHTVPNGIDLEAFDRAGPIDVVEHFGLPGPGAVVVLFAGRIEHRKGGDLLPDVCADLLGTHPEVHVVLAGADDDGIVDRLVRPRLDALGPRTAERLHALGRRSLPEVWALMKHADVFLLPSRWDNAPFGCIEAMAAGLAVVASDVGGIPELVDHGRTGLLVPPGDAAAITDAVADLVDDRTAREVLGAAARAEVERRFTDVISAQRSVDVWAGRG